jgi:adenosylcobinamide-GDP ribazoletransferase
MFNSIRLAFTMFSKLPMGRPEWNEKNMRYMLAAFPLVGVVVGAVVFGWLRICEYFALPDMVRGLGITLIPLVITGGLHLDGFCDTSDALASHADPEKRRAILKDPHTGAFAVIAVVIYLISYFALAVSFPHDTRSAIVLCVGFVLSRAFSAHLVLTLPTVKDGTSKMMQDAASKRAKVIVFAWCMVIVTPLFLADLKYGGNLLLPIAISAIIPDLIIRFQAKRRFGGMSGDLAGWYLQMCEVLQLAAIVLCSCFYARFVV